MFWFDGTEINGTVYLFGKVQVPNGSAAGSLSSPKFVSCAVAVSNVERNLFVLPRSKGEYDAEGRPKRYSLGEVYNEIKGT
jgi:DNA polymerase alpha subunit A